jgi:hypothetical protein
MDTKERQFNNMPTIKQQSLSPYTAMILLNIVTLHLVCTLRIASEPSSFMMSSNPWGVNFESTSAPGFALERVELLSNEMWEITARLSTHESAAYTKNEDDTTRFPVIFMGSPEMLLPTQNRDIESFLSAYTSPDNSLRPWLLEGRVEDVRNYESATSSEYFLQGFFSYDDIPRHSASQFSSIPSERTEAKFNEIHPFIEGTSLVQISIPHIAVQMLSRAELSGAHNILVGVALMSTIKTNEGLSKNPSQNQIYSGVVKLLDITKTPVIRSFTAFTSTSFTFLSHTAMQIIETQIDNMWSYILIITFGLEQGFTSPHVDTTQGYFTISTSIANSDASDWKQVSCPKPLQSLDGCALDILPKNASFCTVEIVASGPDTPSVYRIRMKLGEYKSAPTIADRTFIRMPVHATDGDGMKSVSFMNLQVHLLSSSIRCGAVIVREPSLTNPADGDTFHKTDPIVMTVFSGITLVPMTQDKTGAPLIATIDSYPTTLSTVSNLHARSILDSLVTVSLIGYDDAFALSRNIYMVDLISVHIRDEALHDTMNSLVRTGLAYTIDFESKRITITPQFDSLCKVKSEVCAQRVLIRNGDLLEPSHTHADISVEEDTKWLNAMFMDVDTSKEIADTFISNVYKKLEPDQVIRRVVWVDSSYEWTELSTKSSTKEHMLLFASYNVR